MKVNWERSKALSGWIVSAILALSLFGVVVAVNPSFQTIIEPGSMVSTANYIVFINSGIYYAKNGVTGAITSSSIFSTFLHSLIASLGNSGGSIFITKGTYMASTSINFWDSPGGLSLTYSNIQISGQGAGTIIKMSNSANLASGIFFIGFGVSNVTIKDMLFDGNSAFQTTDGVGIEVRRSSNIIIDNIVFMNFYNSGVFGFDSPITNTTFNNKVINSYFINNRLYGIRLGFASDRWILYGNQFIGNSFGNSGNGGSIYGENSNNITVSYNLITNQFGSGFNIAGIHFRFCLPSMNSVIFDGPIIIGNRVFSSTSEGILVTGCVGANINGNIVTNSKYSGIYLEGSPKSIVIGNIISNSGTNGITIGSMGAFPYFSIQTNVDGNFVTDSLSAGILTDSANVTIHGNTVVNSSKGTLLNSWDYAGIQAYAYYVLIINNRVFDAQVVKTEKYGVSLLLSGGTSCNSCIVEWNDLRGYSVNATYNGGTNNTIANNIY